MGEAWTSQDDAELHRMWMVDGLSAGYIARLLPGNRSRNSIIGRVFRMGWKRQDPQATRAAVGKNLHRIARAAGRGNSPGSRASLKIGQRKTKAPPAEPVRLSITDVLSPNAKPWIERAFGECAFPVGEAEGADQHSCCNPTHGATYCPGHAAKMFAGCPKPNAASREERKRPSPSTSVDIFSRWVA